MNLSNGSQSPGPSDYENRIDFNSKKSAVIGSAKCQRDFVANYNFPGPGVRSKLVLFALLDLRCLGKCY